MKVICVRHGESEANVKGIYNSNPNTKVPLTIKGEKQARETAKKLSKKTFDAIFSSELYRCQQTASILNEPHQQIIIVDSRLNERPNGFEGEPWTKPEELLKKRSDWWYTKFNDGDTIANQERKINAFINDLKKQSYQQVLIVGHLDTIRLLAYTINNLSKKEAWNINTDNAQIEIFDLTIPKKETLFRK